MPASERNLTPAEVLAKLQGGRSEIKSGTVPDLPDYFPNNLAQLSEFDKLSLPDLERLVIPVMEKLVVKRMSLGAISEIMKISPLGIVDVMRTKKWRQMWQAWLEIEAQTLIVHPIARRFDRLERLESVYQRTQFDKPEVALACLRMAKLEMDSAEEALPDPEEPTHGKKAIRIPTFQVNVLPYKSISDAKVHENGSVAPSPVAVEVSVTNSPPLGEGVQ